jgi:hypothetical protein
MSMEVDFSEPYLEETEAQPTPLLTPQYMEVSIAGRPYVVNTSFEPYRRDAFRHRSIQSQRESISLDNIPGTGTVNTEGLWRREAWDWHFGAGQPYQDRKDSVDARFSLSKGMNPWLQWQVELLDDTKQVYAMTGDGRVLQCGQYLYVLDYAENKLKFSSDLSTWTTVDVGLGSGAVLYAMTTDGYNIYVSGDPSFVTAGIASGVAGATTLTPYVTGSQAFTGLWYVGDRLMATDQNNLFNIVVTGAAPAALWTHPNPAFIFTAMAAGSSQIYIGGYVSTAGAPLQSIVYRTTIETTGTALTIPVQALPLEGGEWVSSLYGYLNYIFVGTNLGVRMCRTIAAYDPTGNEGDLEAGPITPGLFPPGPVSAPVDCMTGNNRFVYFGWSEYDSVSSGLGRLDLSTFIDTQAPAFASDLMMTGQTAVTSMDWCTINNAPAFVCQNIGVYTSTGTPVESGYITSGYLGYGISDDKIVLAGDIGTISPQQGTVSMSLASDASSNVFAFVGQQVSASQGGTPNQSVFAVSAIRGEQFTVQLRLTRDPVTNESPIMHRWTLKSIPAITAGTTVSVVIRMWNVEDIAGEDYFFDPYAEKAFLENLRTTQTVFAYTEGPLTYQYCTVDEIDWLPQKRQDAIAYGGFHGDIIVYIKTYDLGA